MPRIEHTQERKCLVTGARLEPDQLIRFVKGPDGRVVPDVAAKLPGRGAWVRKVVVEKRRNNEKKKSENE
jgi:hypothetical protein